MKTLVAILAGSVAGALSSVPAGAATSHSLPSAADTADGPGMPEGVASLIEETKARADEVLASIDPPAADQANGPGLAQQEPISIPQDEAGGADGTMTAPPSFASSGDAGASASASSNADVALDRPGADVMDENSPVEFDAGNLPFAGDEGTVEPPAAVPVPAAAWLFGSGILALVSVSRRRSQR